MGMTLEVAMVPITDVDRAEEFSKSLGRRLDGNTWTLQELTTRLPGR